MAGTAAGSTEAESPTRARETAAARWSRAPRATRNRAETGASCGSRRRHDGPERAQRESEIRQLVRNYISVKAHRGLCDHCVFIGVCRPWPCNGSVEQKSYKSPEGGTYYGLTENDS